MVTLISPLEDFCGITCLIRYRFSPFYFVLWDPPLSLCVHSFWKNFYAPSVLPFLNADRMHLQGYQCRSCDKPPEAHVHCYTHRQGSLTISVRKLTEFVLTGERDGKIWMWHRCLKCPWSNGFPPATQRIVMSDAAWGLSLGKFLELSFSNHAAASRVASCGHSLHRDCLRFYGWAIFSHFILLDPRRKKYTWVHMKSISFTIGCVFICDFEFKKGLELIHIPCIWMVLVHPCSLGFMSVLISKSLLKDDQKFTWI